MDYQKRGAELFLNNYWILDRYGVLAVIKSWGIEYIRK